MDKLLALVSLNERGNLIPSLRWVCRTCAALRWNLRNTAIGSATRWSTRWPNNPRNRKNFVR